MAGIEGDHINQLEIDPVTVTQINCSEPANMGGGGEHCEYV